ncbi:MAG: TraR/DksA C4-type zinc finger protein [Microbacterium sp.]
MSGAPASRLERERDSLVERIARLDETLAGLQSDRGAETADDEHDPEGATLSSEWSRLAGLRADAVTALAETDAALARAASGGYGICSDCGDVIPPARLDARPTATRCVACATKAGA